MPGDDLDFLPRDVLWVVSVVAAIVLSFCGGVVIGMCVGH